MFSQTDLDKLLKRYDISEFVQYIEKKGILSDQERVQVKGLKTRQEIVFHLHIILQADSHKLEVFLDEFYLFASECLSITLHQTIELKKQKLPRLGNKHEALGETVGADSCSKANVHRRVRKQDQCPALHTFSYPGDGHKASDHVSSLTTFAKCSFANPMLYAL